MRILFLSQRFLLPMDTGGKIRTGKILEQLSTVHEITLISNVESPKDDAYLPKTKKLCTKFIAVPWREVKKYTGGFYIRLFCQMFSRYPVSVLNDYSNTLRIAVEKECRQHEYDLAICDFVQSALMFKNIHDIPTLLFQHNVESLIARRHITQATNLIAKCFWWLQWRKMSFFEARTCRTFDAVIAVSEKDLQQFEHLYRLDNIVTIPTGVDIDYFSPPAEAVNRPDSLVFCGSMDWLPNEDAMIFFITEILPTIKQKKPDACLTIVGRNPSPSLQKLVDNSPEVELTGWVEDTRPYINDCMLFIVPLRIGGGTRMKIYEAMAMGKAVISTWVGAEGLPVTADENIILVDDPQEFGDKVVRLLENEQLRNSIGHSANTFVRRYFSWQHVASEFSDICRSVQHVKCLPATSLS